MYKFYFFLLSFFIFLSMSCQEKELAGLVAKYTFDGNALDLSGNRNHAEVDGAVLTSDRFGNEKRAYRFDGTSAYILGMVSNMPVVDSPQTISLWFMIEQPPTYLDSLGADNIIALVDTTAGVGVQVGYRAPGYHTSGLDTWYWGGRSILESEQPAINEWHHCVYTFDGQTHLFYLNGKQVAQSSVEPQEGTPNMLMFGNYPGGNQYYSGSLDDVHIYNRVLSTKEIEFLYNKKD